MPFTPQSPFPKSRADTVRSGDWNDAITELQRLDTAKVNRTGDVITGGLAVDGPGANSGARDPGLSFGSPSGETIASTRTAGGPNRYGLDLFTNSLPRLSIDNAGRVGIGTRTPQAALDIPGGDVRWARSRLTADQGGSIELGADNATPGAGGTPFIDFHFGAATQDYNVRVINDADRQLRIDTAGGRLVVSGALRVEGAQNIINVWTTTFTSQNAGVNAPRSSTVNYAAAGFTQVYCVVPVMQAFSIFSNAYATNGHVADVGAIPQAAWVRLEPGWNTQQAVITTYCSESVPGNETDNTVAVTVLVLGRT
ncbi:MAG TPA: hypothetical protein VI300_24395 [Solirubrobacter sp.]